MSYIIVDVLEMKDGEVWSFDLLPAENCVFPTIEDAQEYLDYNHISSSTIKVVLLVDAREGYNK